MTHSQWIVNTTEESFQQDVLERSREVPVILDFWAPWCGPCRVLGPILEKLTEEAAGRFVLVKANTEEMPNAATMFRVQGIPAVFAVVDGQPVDGFVGLLPEVQLKAWLDRISLAGEYQRAQMLEASQPGEAKAIYQRLHELDPQRAEPRIALARIAIGQGEIDGARQWIEQLEERGFLEPEAQKLKAALDLQDKKQVDMTAIRDAARRAPENLQIQYEFAEALAAQQQYQEAMDVLLQIIERDRQGVGEPARLLMVDLFRILGDDAELTNSYRRKLSALLY